MRSRRARFRFTSRAEVYNEGHSPAKLFSANGETLLSRLSHFRGPPRYNVLVGDAENCNLTVIPQKDTKGQEFDLAWTKGDDGPEALRNIEVHRKELRKYLRSIGRPIPKFLHEKFDDAPPPPPDQVLIDLDVRILRFLVEWEKLQIKEGRVMTNSHVHCKFTGEQEESVRVLDQRLIHLEKTGYITATVEPKPSLGIPETKHIEIHGVTEKGRKALRA